MPNISDIITHLDITQKTYKVVKPRKDNEKRRLRARLAELTGRTEKSIWASTMIWSEDMLLQGIRACENFSNIKLRNLKFNDYIKETKK